MSVNLAGLSVLILHDEVPMSLALNAVIANAGCRNISTFYHTSIARLWLDRFSPQLAILEVSMDDDGCYELVVSLIEKRVPVVIYSEDGHPPEQARTALRGIAWMSKKADAHTIHAAIQSAFATLEASAGDDAVFDQGSEDIRETSGNG